MGIFTPFHPEITTGSIEDFGFHKVKRQVKTVYVNVVSDFLLYSKKIHGLDISELAEVSNMPGQAPRIFVERDFPYQTRKIPLITPIITNITERKPYIGIDNYLYPGVIENPDGTNSGYDVYANMYDIELRMLVVAESNELRDQLLDLLMACFTNYYRGTYTYRDDIDNEFIITPSTRRVSSGNDSEITEENTTNLIFIGDITLKAFVEYHYKAYGEERYSTAENVAVGYSGTNKGDADPVFTEEVEVGRTEIVQDGLYSGPIEFER